jgi:hypothetical protein
MTPVAAAIELGATPIAVDEGGVPRLMRGSAAMPAMAAGDATTAARQHVERLAPAWGVSAGAVPTLEALGEIPLPGGTIVRLRQVIDGLPIDAAAGGELRVMVGKDGSLVAASGKLVASTTPRKAAVWKDDDAGAIARAVSDVYKLPFSSTTLAMKALGGADTRMLAGQAGPINVSLSRARQAWIPSGDALVAAWVVEAYASNAKSTDGDAFRSVIAADDGRVLSYTNLKADVAFKYRVFAETTGELHPFEGPVVDVTPHATGIPNSVPYPAYVLPNLVTVDGLNHPAGSTAPDPWLAPGRTETIGNNVEAYTDINAPDGLTFGDFRATITGPGVFDRTYDTSLSALSSQGQQMAGITSVFYIFNWLHDFWYDAGFTEAAGNAQNVNFGRGGEDRDAMNCEAQDNANGGSRNNANMSTPQDGFPPRMQVFVWTGKEDRSLSISGRTPPTGPASFGATGFTVTADVVLANNAGSASPSDACTALTAPATGKIVLADRGTCSFKTKALNAQNAGAVGLIIATNAPAAAPPSLGDDATITTPITIGVVSILQSEGVTIKGELLAGPVTATVHRGAPGAELEGSLDATVMAHENGHYVHHRLSSCNTTLCGAMSEGWADFAALLVMTRPGDNLNGAFPAAIYSTQSFAADPVYYGIRRAPYSVNQAINGLSFRHMAVGTPLPPLPFNGGATSNNNEVHNGGEVWASMLWEGYVALQQQPGATFDAVRLKMRQYVVGGLLLAPTDATPTETRDAILLAALAANPADHDVLAAAYARRGFGSCAVSPDRQSTTFTGIVESSEVKGKLIAGAPTLQLTHSCDTDGVLDGGETARITVPLANAGPADLAGVAVTLSSTTPGIHVTTPTATVGAVARYGSASVTFDVTLDDTATTALSGDFNLALATSNGCATLQNVPFSVRLNTDDVQSASATDTFDAAASVWTPAGNTGVWSHNRRSALDGFWFAADAGAPSDASLVSPPVTAGAGPVTIAFTHKFSFEFSGTSAFDGGVVEYSTDNGATFQDISALANPGYNTTLVGTPGTTGNPLAGRPAYGHTNAAFPAVETVTLSLGTALSGQTFRLRFRAGSDTNTGAPGWEIDNLVFTGIVGTPFPSQVTDTGTCNTTPGCTIVLSGPATGTFGSPIHLTAAAACNTGPAQIQWLHKVNSSNVIIQPFGAASTLDFTADAVGTSSFFAVARTQGTTTPQTTSNTVNVSVADNAPLCTSVKMVTPVNAQQIPVNTSQTLTASAVCPAGAVPEFQFWVKPPGAANFTILPGYTTGSSSFVPSPAGAWAVKAVARAVGAHVSYQVSSSSVSVTVTP